MRSARNRLHAPPVEFDPRVVVPNPLPVFTGAKRLHDRLAKHLGQWPAEQMQQRERELVDADVVVFPVRSRRLYPPQVALVAIGRAAERHRAKVVRLVRQSETFAAPFTRLLKQMCPGNAGIVLIIEADTRYTYMHRLANIRQQAAIK